MSDVVVSENEPTEIDLIKSSGVASIEQYCRLVEDQNDLQISDYIADYTTDDKEITIKPWWSTLKDVAYEISDFLLYPVSSLLDKLGIAELNSKLGKGLSSLITYGGIAAGGVVTYKILTNKKNGVKVEVSEGGPGNADLQ
jgi:hypothetical protein